VSEAQERHKARKQKNRARAKARKKVKAAEAALLAEQEAEVWKARRMVTR